jgi:nucleoside phosphorylase
MRADVAIYTIRPDEFNAVFDRLGQVEEQEGASGQRYQLARLGTPSGDVAVALFRGVQQGNTEARTLIQRAIEDLSPRWVVVVGIAGAIPHKDFTIGDVVVATEFLDFTYEVKHDGSLPELHPHTLPLHRAAHALLGGLPPRLRQIAQWSSEPEIGMTRPPPPTLEQILDGVSPEYEARLREAIAHHRETPRTAPTAVSGVIGSSNSLQKSTEFAEILIRGHRNLYCVEMESAGAWEACNAGEPIPLLTVRGISDIIGVRRGDSLTRYACQSAASVAVLLIRSGALRISNAQPPTDDQAGNKGKPSLPTANLGSDHEKPILDGVSAEIALRNIGRYGDTDIFPRPFEIGIFRDAPASALTLLARMHESFEDYFPRFPPDNVSALSPVGYAGFRWSSQLDPLYNAYLLSLVLSIAADLEAARLPIASSAVFSYRLDPSAESGRLFSESIGWDTFNQSAQALAQQFTWVVRTDIADFYPRISHARLRETLTLACRGDPRVERILSILAQFSRGSGIGLPIGGPAARILAEAYLNPSDHILEARGIAFCRFVDDYILFADSENDAHRVLAQLAEILGENDSLSLQKLKTRIMRRNEFLRDYEHEIDADIDRETLSFLRLRLRYDPYSETAEEDYRTIQENLEGHDILGMLTREIKKSRINQQLTKKLLHAGRFLPDHAVDAATVTLADNLRALLSVFGSVSALISSLLDRSTEDTRQFLRGRLLSLLDEDEGPPPLDLHRIAIVRLLAAVGAGDSATSGAIWKEYSESGSPLVRKECIWALNRLKNIDLVRVTLGRFDRSSAWEKRALIAASYGIDSDGKTFRDRIRASWNPFEELVDSWCTERDGKVFPEG